MKVLNKSFLSFFLALAIIFSTSIFSSHVFADSGQQEGKIVKIIIVENGKQKHISGEEARLYYENTIKKNNAENILQSNMLNYDKSLNSTYFNDEITPSTIKFKYEYVEKERKDFFGKAFRISKYLKNTTKRPQNMSFRIAFSSSWSINAGITGKFLDEVLITLGGNWAKTYTVDDEINCTVSPNRTGWIEFQPKYRYSSGVVLHKFKDRRTHKWFVMRSKNVETMSPRAIWAPVNEKWILSPDGAYIIREGII